MTAEKAVPVVQAAGSFGPLRSAKASLLQRFATPALVACIGIAAGLGLFGMVRSWEQSRVAKEFEGIAHERFAAFESHMQLHMQSLDTLKAFFLGSEKVERWEFRTFADILLRRRTHKQILGWIARVPDGQREVYEAARRNEGFEDFGIRLWSQSDQDVVAREGEWLFPVHFVEPQADGRAMLGLDLTSNPACQEAMVQARDTGLITGTAPLRLGGENADQRSMVIFLPVYEKAAPVTSTEDRRQNLLGYVFRVDVVSNIMADVVRPLTPVAGVDLLVLDLSAPPGRQFLGVHWSRLKGPPHAGLPTPANWREVELSEVAAFNVAGRSWQVLCKPTEVFIAEKTTWAPWLGLLSTWGVTGLLVAYLQTIRTGRTRTEALAADLSESNEGLLAEIQERERAEEALRESESRYRAIFEGAAHGILVPDIETTKFLYANPTICSMLGYSQQELLGMAVKNIHPKDQLDAAMSNFRAQVSGQSDHASNVPCLRKDGEIIYADISSATVVLDGKPCIMGFFTDVTARRRAERAVKFQAMLLDQIDDQVTATDLQGRITYVNVAEARDKGFTKAELIGQSVAVFGEDPDLGAAQMEIVERTLRDGRWEGEIVNYTKDGERRILQVRTRLVHDPQGRPTALCGVSTDVTERRQAEQALRESEQRYRAIFESAAEGILIADIETKKYLFANPAVSAMLGYSEGELLNMGIQDIHPPEDMARNIARFEVAATAKTKVVLDIPCVRKDGTIVFADINTGAISLDGRECLVGMFTDVTERRRADQALRESEKRYRQLVEGLSEGIAATDRNGIITFVNRAFAEIIGNSAEALVGGDFFGSINNYQRDAFRGALLDPSIGSPDYQVMLLRGDDKLLYLSMHGSPIMDDQGNHAGTLIVVSDITKRRQAEESLKKAHRQLMYAGEQERHALATDLHDSLGQQAVAMHLAVESLLTRAKQADDAYVRELARLSQACQSLTEDIRNTCYGLYPPTLETLGLCSALRQLLRDNEHIIKAKMACCEKCEDIKLAPDIEIALFRIAQEAVSNVLRHGKAEHMELNLEMDGMDVVLTVSDDGVDFDVENTEAGLGLLSMRERANAVGGSLEISSQPGRTSVVARIFLADEH